MTPETQQPGFDCGRQTAFYRTPTASTENVAKQTNTFEKICGPN